MLEDIIKHTIHYLILFFILSLGLLGFWYFSYSPDFQWLIVLATAFSYVFWGIVHHLVDEDLNIRIVVEYTLFAALAVAVFSWVLKGGL